MFVHFLNIYVYLTAEKDTLAIFLFSSIFYRIQFKKNIKLRHEIDCIYSPYFRYFPQAIIKNLEIH